MTLGAAISAPILRTASGEPPLGRDAAFFLDHQGEIFEHDNPRYRSSATRIGVLALDNGKWLALPPGFAVQQQQHDSRDQALRSGIHRMLRRARRYMRNGEGEGTQWTEGYARRVMEWALSLKPDKQGLDHRITAQDAPVIGHPATADDTAGVTDDCGGDLAGAVNQPEQTDPVIRALIAAHKARKAYPAGHVFSMTNPIVNGQMVTLGTCSCGDSFSYAWGCYERMDAAIEAHLQKFDHLPSKVDGRGQPIDALDSPKAKKPRKRKSSPDEGLFTAATATADATGPATEPAPSTLSGAGDIEAAPDGAGSTGRLDDLGSVQDGRKMSTDGQPVASGLHTLAGEHRSENEAMPGPSAAETDGPAQPAQICAGDTSEWDALPEDVRAQAEADGTDELLKAALGLAWHETPPPKPIDLAPRDVTRPLLRWHGGKWRLAPWIMSHFPKHHVYVEPYGGAGSVLMRKPRVYAEVYNDLDDVVINLFRVLRDDAKAARLVEALRMTPFARGEFEDALLDAEDDVERARHLIVRSFMGFGSNAHSSSSTADKTGFKSFTRPDQYRSTGFRANSNRSGTTPAHDWANYPDALPAAIDRLRGVIVENRPAIDVMKQHDGEATLHYVDPPYLPETRSPANKYDLKHRMYRHELTVDDHRDLLAFLQTLKGYVVLSGYPSTLYDEALPDWHRVTTSAQADGARERTEVLWINPACAAALDAEHPQLFDLAAFDAVNTPQRT